MIGDIVCDDDLGPKSILLLFIPDFMVSVVIMPFDISPLLRCPLCHLQLQSPNTFHCGHSLCASHRADSCPLPACQLSTLSPPPNIPSSSSVVYLPAESPPPAVPPTSTPHVDVTISKIISLVSRVQSELPPDVPPSSSRVRRHSSSSPPRVRKRRRYSHSPDHDDDLLSHLRRQSALQRSTPRDEPLIPSTLLSRFEKDLLVELTCDICCVLFFQPITTPCQHVCPCFHSILLI
jgi:hypothetical protein